MTKQEIIDYLGLEAHPEGGYYKRTYSSSISIGERESASAIYYMLGEGDVSHFHRLKSDELWHHYDGGDILIHTFDAEDEYKAYRVGKSWAEGALPQVCIPANTWMAAELITDEYVLVGCSLSPAFHFEDFELATENSLDFAQGEFKGLLERFILKPE